MKADAAAPAPAPAAPPAAAEGPPSAPFRVLEAAEETVGTLEVELASVRAAFDLIDVEDVEAADELDNVARRGTALVATAGRLQGELDELEFGNLEAAVRDEARAERRAVHARLEQLLPEASALQKRVPAARSMMFSARCSSELSAPRAAVTRGRASGPLPPRRRQL